MKSQCERSEHTTVESERRFRAREKGRCGRSSAAALLMLTALAVLVGTTGRAQAKSLYVITAITTADRPTPIHAYNIAWDGTLAFQAEYGIHNYGNGVVGIAIDSYSEQLFITFEESNTILLLNAGTLSDVDTVSAPEAENLAGIVYDHGKELLYCVDRGTDKLYCYHWDAAKKRLDGVPGSPFHLEGSTAYGIALDEISDLLYVANASRKVTVYSTWDWRLMRTISLGTPAISVAVDPQRRYLYYGAGYVYIWDLVRYDLATGAEKRVQIAPDAGAIGISVDTSTGMVYTTTGADNRPGGDDLLVFTPEFELVQSINDIGSATGLVVPPGQTSYNPLRFTKTIKTTGGSEPNDRTLPEIVIGDEVSYFISFDYQGFGLTEVLVEDRLPSELTFVDATGDGVYGQYDPNTRTYIWHNPPLTGGRVSLQLVARLKPTTPVGRIITNLAMLNTDKTPPTTTGIDAIATAATYRPLHISKAVVTGSTSTSGQTVYVSPGDQVSYRICIDNKDNEHTVANVVVRDSLPAQVEFVSATGDGDYGAYDPVSHAYLWSYPLLSAGQSACVDLVVRVANDVLPGMTITNTASVRSDQTPDTNDADTVVVAQTPLELRKTILAGAGGTPDERGRLGVNAGGEITYGLTFKNPSLDQTVTRVALTDALPPEVSFVRASTTESTGSYNPADHTYTWLCNPLAPQEEVTMKLVVQVDEHAEPNTVISNWAEVRSQETPATKARVDVVVQAQSVQLPADLFFDPPHLFRNNSKDTKSLMVILHLPEGYGRELIADTPLVMTPGAIEATSQSVFGTSTQGKIVGFFPTSAILAATEGYGGVRLTVTGRLKDGRAFVGQGVLTIFFFGGGP
jgi:uncharacterized repeat protein (TIGR01451 family)